MTTQAFTNAVFAAIDAVMTTEFPGVPVMYENGPEIDEAAAGDVFVDVEVRWYGASVASVGLNPLGRHTGAISAQVYYKQAEGTAAVGSIVDRLIAELKSKRIGGGITKMPQRSVPTHLEGWYKSGIFVPFHLDDQ